MRSLHQDDKHQSHMSHFDANGVFRIASNSAGRSHLPVSGLGSAAFGRGGAAGASQLAARGLSPGQAPCSVDRCFCHAGSVAEQSAPWPARLDRVRKIRSCRARRRHGTSMAFSHHLKAPASPAAPAGTSTEPQVFPPLPAEPEHHHPIAAPALGQVSKRLHDWPQLPA